MVINEPFTSKLFQDRLLMNSFKINNQIHIICNSESKQFDVGVDNQDDIKKGDDPIELEEYQSLIDNRTKMSQNKLWNFQKLPTTD